MITYAFFIGYLLSQIPGGYLAQTYSMTWVVGLGTGLTSLLTCSTAIAARFSLYAFLGLRFFEGLFEVRALTEKSIRAGEKQIFAS